MALPLDEFLRRFLLTLLPRGFVPIRNFDFLANRRRALLLPLCTHLPDSAHESNPAAPLAPRTVRALTFGICPFCGGPIHVIERPAVIQIQLRAPPFPREYAARSHASTLDLFAYFDTHPTTASRGPLPKFFHSP
jgi:hypothetical protein